MRRLILAPVIAFGLLFGGCAEPVDPILWEESADDESASGTRITKIELVRETCDMLTVNIGYVNDGSLPGYVEAGINARVDDAYWPMIPKTKEGTHTIEAQAGIQDKAKPQKSHEIMVSLEHINENTWQGYVDKRSVSYEKEWDHGCK
jgi:hypothetical protein